jgi:hypothetical protein
MWEAIVSNQTRSIKNAERIRSLESDNTRLRRQVDELRESVSRTLGLMEQMLTTQGKTNADSRERDRILENKISDHVYWRH